LRYYHIISITEGGNNRVANMVGCVGSYKRVAAADSTSEPGTTCGAVAPSDGTPVAIPKIIIDHIVPVGQWH